MKKKINIFLDSNATFSDPLFKTIFGKLLLQLSENNKVDIFISRVVYEESINNYEKCIKKNVDIINQANSDLRKLLNKSPNIPGIKVNELTSQFQFFLRTKIENNTFSIIEYEDSYLKELINRSINRIFPFTEHRQEFRDTTIWISYANYINDNSLSNNFLITNNKKDFWNSKKDDLHDELRKEVKDLTIYSSIPEFCSKEKELLKIKGEKEFSEWLNKEPLDKNILINSLLTKYWKSIKRSILESIDTSNPSKYFGDDKYVYFEYQYNKENIEINSMDIREITDFAFVTCNLIITGFGLFYPKQNVWSKEKKDIRIVLKMTFNLFQKFELNDFKIADVRLNYAQQRT